MTTTYTFRDILEATKDLLCEENGGSLIQNAALTVANTREEMREIADDFAVEPISTRLLHYKGRMEKLEGQASWHRQLLIGLVVAKLQGWNLHAVDWIGENFFPSGFSLAVVENLIANADRR